MPLTNDAAIADLLGRTRNIALVGASDRPDRASFGVMAFLQHHGYRVFPVNPVLAGNMIHGERVLATLANVPVPIDLVDVFRNSAAADAVVDDAIAVGAKAIWMQLGVINLAAAERAEGVGIAVVMDRCPKIEIPRLGLPRVT